VYTAVYVRVAPARGIADDVFMDKLCSSVEAYLSDKVMVGSTAYAEPRRFFDLWRNIYIQSEVHVTEGFNRTSVRGSVEVAIRAVLDFDAVDFGTDVTIGAIYRAALSVPGVDWVELTYLADTPPAPQTAAEPTTTLFTGLWGSDASVDVTTNPGNGDVRVNAGSTTLAVSKQTSVGINNGEALVGLTLGDHLISRQSDNAERWTTFLVVGDASDIHVPADPSWVTVPVAVADTGSQGAPETGGTGSGAKKVILTAVRYAVQEEGRVLNLTTSPLDGTNLLIPRIEPTEVVEDEADYPDISEEERTHDGLWVTAVGGLVNT
jgi:hypothetical protein